MPFNRRVPFFNLNKNQQTFQQLREEHEFLKQRLNTNESKSYRQPNGIEIATDDLLNNNNNINDYYDDYDHCYDKDKVFHTICVGNTSTMRQYLITKNINWVRLEESIINLFQNNGRLKDGQLKETYEHIETLMNTNQSMFVFDRIKSQVLTKAIRLLKTNMIDDTDDDVDDADHNGDNGKNNYLNKLGSLWKTFYHDILSTLECMLFSIESSENLSIRKTTLILFRDLILIDSPIEEKIKESLKNNEKISPNIVQMLLIIHHTYERYPPSENNLKIEKISALIISPLIGYLGIYENYSQTPVIHSNEPNNPKCLLSSLKNQSKSKLHQRFDHLIINQQNLIKQQQNFKNIKDNNHRINLNHHRNSIVTFAIDYNDNNLKRNQNQLIYAPNKTMENPKWNRTRKVSLPHFVSIYNHHHHHHQPSSMMINQTGNNSKFTSINE